MYGFIGGIAHDNKRDYCCEPHNIEKCIYNQIQCDEFEIKQCTLEKFEDDKIFYESDEYVIAIEGVIYNYNHLCDEYKIKNRGKLLEYLFTNNKTEDFCNLLDGYYAGAIFNKKEKNIVLITDHIGYRPIWYFLDDDHFMFSTDIDWLYRSIRCITGKLRMNTDAFTCLLNYGYMLGDVTLADKVMKVLPGQYLKTALDMSVKIGKYYSVPIAEKNVTEPLDVILKKIDEELSSSIQKAYEKDEEYGYAHVATVSGGLDSRIMLFKACQLGYKTTCLTMGESGCGDIVTSSKICDFLKQEHLIYELNNGLYLSEIETSILANGGNIMWPGFAHGYEMRKLVSLEKFGAIHSGDCGDAILGGSLYEGKEKLVIDEKFDLKRDVLAYGKAFLGAFSDQFEQKEKERYSNKVLFNYYNRGVNSAGNGVYGTQYFSEGSSPFMSRGMLDLMFRLPYEYTKDHNVYIEYMKNYMPKACDYTWDKTGCKPDASNLSKWLARWKRRINYRIFHRYSSMNPYDKWYKQNGELRDYLDSIYKELNNIQFISSDLKQMILGKYSSEHTLDKTLACVAISTIRKYEMEI